MTLNDSQAIAPACGGALAALKAVITFGASMETVFYAILGTAVGFLVTEVLKWGKKYLPSIIRNIKNKFKK